MVSVISVSASKELISNKTLQTDGQTFGSVLGPVWRSYCSQKPTFPVPEANASGSCTEPVPESVQTNIPNRYVHRQVSKAFA